MDQAEDGKRRWQKRKKDETEIERSLANRVRLSKGKRKISSRRWLERQLADPYVRRAKEAGYRCRSAFKLQEINARFGLIGRGSRILDLGCAPGGWAQMALECGAKQLVGIDLQETEALPGAVFLQGDIHDPEMGPALVQALDGPIDLIMSDMASSSAGHRPTDHARTAMLAECAVQFALTHLCKGGAFCCKVFQGGIQGEDLQVLKANFAQVRHFKPPASRSESAETFVIAKGYAGQ